MAIDEDGMAAFRFLVARGRVWTLCTGYSDADSSQMAKWWLRGRGVGTGATSRSSRTVTASRSRRTVTASSVVSPADGAARRRRRGRWERRLGMRRRARPRACRAVALTLERAARPAEPPGTKCWISTFIPAFMICHLLCKRNHKMAKIRQATPNVLAIRIT